LITIYISELSASKLMTGDRKVVTKESSVFTLKQALP